jgi:hypothetical protein
MVRRGTIGVERAYQGGFALETGNGAPTTEQERTGASQPPPQPPGAVKRVLLLANETVGASGVMSHIKELVGGESAEVFVVAPALASSPLKFAAGEVDDAIEAARLRLDSTLHALREMGFAASGEVGDSDPNLALEDALRRFPADEVVIATHPKGRSKWLEWDVVGKARSELSIPITHAVVDLEQGGIVTAVERAPGFPHDEPPTATAYDLPRLTKREAAGALVGIAGTIALGILAITCSGDISEEGMSAGCAIRIGVAIAAFIVTVFHVLALLFFGSVRYHGRASKLAADTLLYGIPPAILISALVS